MKKIKSFTKIVYIIIAAFLIVGCVHDDKYNAPDLNNYECQDLTATMTYAQVRAKYTANTPANTTFVFPDTSTDVIEGYVSSSDETGNIYKTIFIQDKVENPTQGFTISVDAVSTYTKFPQGAKIYIKLKGLAVGTYGGLIQLGVKDASVTTTNGVARIPEAAIPSHIFRSCNTKSKIVPKVMTLAEMITANDQLLGCLIQVNNAEFDKKVLCTNYAPDGTSVDKQINDPGTAVTTRVVRNSGFASFANQILPAGKGKFVGILSKYNSSYQMYINRVSDLDMDGGDKNGDGIDEHFPRTDGISANPCAQSATLMPKTVAEVKALYTSGAFTQITGNFSVKGKVTANDETGNLYKYIYFEDATGGIRININKTNLYQDNRFKVGKEVIVSLKDLYIGNVSGELQLGVPFNGAIGQIAEIDVYKYFFSANTGITPVIPTEKTLTNLTQADVGRWIKIKDLEFVNADLGKPYAVTTTTNRTLEDCSNHTIILRTSNFASFSSTEVDGGKGDVYGVLSIFNGTYQLWITNLLGADLDKVRCDGSVPPKTIFAETFSGNLTDNWTSVSVTGTQVWNIQNFGNPAPCAVMSGFSGGNLANEDWLISKPINLTGYSQASLIFDSAARFAGDPLQVLVTDNYTGTPSTTTWTTLLSLSVASPLPTSYIFTSSSNLSLNAFANKKITIAYKYTSTTSAATTWELDNIRVKGN